MLQSSKSENRDPKETETSMPALFTSLIYMQKLVAVSCFLQYVYSTFLTFATSHYSLPGFNSGIGETRLLE